MLGEGGEVLGAIAAGTHPWAERLRQAKNPMVVLGQGALARPDGAQILGAAREIAERCGLVRDGWNGFNILHRAPQRGWAVSISALCRNRAGMTLPVSSKIADRARSRCFIFSARTR